MMSFLFLLWSFVVFVSVEARIGYEMLFESIRAMVLCEDLKAGRYEDMKNTIGYTFPRGINCFSETYLSILSAEMYLRAVSLFLLQLRMYMTDDSSGISRMADDMDWMVELSKLGGDTWREDPHLRLSISSTFPGDVINCFTFTRDSSLFSERMFILFQESNVIPPIAIDDVNNKLGCRGFFIFARNLTTFKEVLTKLPRWSTHRIYGLIQETDVQEITDILQDEIRLFADAEVALFIYGDWSSGFKLGQPIRNFERIGNFTDNANETWEVNFEGYRNFFGRELRFSTTNCSIFSVVNEGRDADRFQGIDWKVFREMARRMNLTVKYVKPLPGSNLGVLVNGTWQGGIIGSVFHGHADIAFCGNWIENSKINTGIQLSSPIQRMCINYLVPRPKRAIGKWYAIFSPFSGFLWLLLGLTIFFVSCIVNIVSLTMRRLLDYRAHFYESRINALMVTYGILMLGSWPSSKKKQGPARHIVTSWVIFALLITTSFSSTLVSHLAKPKFSKKPETIKDLLDMGYTWTENAPFPVERLLNMDDQDVRKWTLQMKVISDTEERLALLKQDENNVIIGADIWGIFTPYYTQPIPDDVLDGYETMDGCLAEIFEGFIYRSGSPFNEDFNFYIKQLRESGLVGKYARTVIGEAVSKNPVLGRLKLSVTSIPGTAQPLSMAELQGVFEFLLLGHIASLLVYLGERLYFRRTKSKTDMDHY